MKMITLLDQNTIDQIAAGEVVERPASVVKELMENAIDAKASAITVEIKDGGTSLIRITDNGEGIPADQIRLAFLRHATSKLRRPEDLIGVATLGFRGEALSSISAVSRVELITKTQESLCGSRYCIEGGTEKGLEEIGAPGGTTFLVRNLFFNTPARAKFLKSATAEGNQITSVVEQLALSHPEISFKYISNGQNKLYTSGNGNRKEIVYQIYGREMTRELLPVEADLPGMHLYGFIGKPSIARGNRNYENYYVNGRYVKNAIISKAIEDGYHGFMMQHRYPFTLLYLEIDGSKVDVNVHPAKREVRFSSREEIYHQICLAVQNTLMSGNSISASYPGSEAQRRQEEREQRKREEEAQKKRKNSPEPFEQAARAAGAAVFPMPEKPSFLSESGNKISQVNPVCGSHQHSRADENLSGKQNTAASGTTFVTKETSKDQDPSLTTERTALPLVSAHFERSDRKNVSVNADTSPIQTAEGKTGNSGTETFSRIDTDADPKAEPASAEHTVKNAAFPQMDKTYGNSSAQILSESQAPYGKTSLSAREQLISDRGALTNETISPEKASYEQLSLFPQDVLSGKNRKNIRILGQVFDTYWIAQMGDMMLMIDQHAAHEKIMYEKMLREYREKAIQQQMLMPPVIISLSLNEAELMKENQQLFADCGYEIEAFGGREYKICSVPSNLGRVDTRQLFRELLDSLSEIHRKQTPEALLEKLASAACKAAVKGNQQLSLPEAEALADQLMSLENPYHCPHGRPTIVEMSRTDLDRKFKRIL